MDKSESRQGMISLHDYPFKIICLCPLDGKLHILPTKLMAAAMLVLALHIRKMTSDVSD